MHRRTRKRFELVGQARYLTFSCYRRLPLFNDREVRCAFIRQLFADRAYFDFSLTAWVVMPEHVHLLILPPVPDCSVTDILASLKRRSSRTSLDHFRRTKSTLMESLIDSSGVTRFWQKGGGYDRNIHTREELLEKINYIHTNPVRRKLAKYPTDWAWSSARAWAGRDTEWPEYDAI